MKTKPQLRKEIDEKRRSLDSEWITSASLRMADQLQRLNVFRSAQCIALYKAISGEVDLECLFETCWHVDKRTCIPVFNSAQKTYEFGEITAETVYVKGHYGISEPKNPIRVPTDTVDLIILPGVAFDTKGNRLGRGGGYYDRLLDGFSGSKMAVAFDFQLFLHIPHEAYDIPVSCIVTESQVINVCNER